MKTQGEKVVDGEAKPSTLRFNDDSIYEANDDADVDRDDSDHESSEDENVRKRIT